MRTTYKLKKGSYFIGDPATIVIKNDDGEEFLKKLWDTFYKDHNAFQKLKIKGAKFLITRTEGGDGIFNGIGTDTGVIMIADIDELKDKRLFKDLNDLRNVKILSYDHDTSVSVKNFNIYFEDFVVETE